MRDHIGGDEYRIIDGKQKSRRRFLKDAAAYGGAVASLSSLPSRASTKPVATNDGPKGTLPRGKLGKLEVSRLILGGNPLGGVENNVGFGEALESFLYDRHLVASRRQSGHCEASIPVAFSMGFTLGLHT